MKTIAFIPETRTSLSASSITPFAASHHAQRGGGWYNTGINGGGGPFLENVFQNPCLTIEPIPWTKGTAVRRRAAARQMKIRQPSENIRRRTSEAAPAGAPSRQWRRHMKTLIADSLDAFIDRYCARQGFARLWHRPIVRFADAGHPAFAELKKVAFAEHAMPGDFLDRPRTVVSYFLPFVKEVADSNLQGEPTSAVWANTYLVTNRMAMDCNLHIAGVVRERGYRAAPPENIGFDPVILKSRWSQRHVAWIAGHGSFGINNMLIGEQGCCGRYFSVVTDLSDAADQPVTDEYCLYKKKGVCKVCVKRCFSGALTENGFDRTQCYAVCRVNEVTYKDAEVCGKCVVGLPCSFRRP